MTRIFSRCVDDAGDDGHFLATVEPKNGRVQRGRATVGGQRRALTTRRDNEGSRQATAGKCGDGLVATGGYERVDFYDGDLTTDSDGLRRGSQDRQVRGPEVETGGCGDGLQRRAASTGCDGLACDGRGRTGGRNPEKMGCRGDEHDGQRREKVERSDNSVSGPLELIIS